MVKTTSRKYFIIGILIVSLVIFILFILNSIYLKESSYVDISQENPVHTLDVKTIIDVIKNEDESFIKTDEVVEIKGVIKEINYLNNRVTILLGTDNIERAYVICDMQSDQKEGIVKLNPKDTIKLKGVFKGILSDAIFLNCVISN